MHMVSDKRLSLNLRAVHKQTVYFPFQDNSEFGVGHTQLVFVRYRIVFLLFHYFYLILLDVLINIYSQNGTEENDTQKHPIPQIKY